MPRVSKGNAILKLLPIDPWRLCDALHRRAAWIILSSLGVAMIGFNWAYLAGTCTATVKLVRTIPAGAAALKLEDQTFALREQSLQATLDLLQSPELLRRVVRASQARLNPDGLSSHSRIAAGSPKDPITITYRGSSPTDAVQVINAYAREAIRLSSELQRDELKQITGFLAAKLSETDNSLKESSRKLINNRTAADVTDADTGTLAFLHESSELEKKAERLRFQLSTLDLRINRLVQEIAKQHPSLVRAREELDRALVRFTDEHPKVKELRAAIAAIREQITQQATNAPADLSVPANSTASTLYLRIVDLQTEKIVLQSELDVVLLAGGRIQEKLQKLPDAQVQYMAANTDYKSLQARRELLAKYHADAQFLLENASGSLRVFQWAREEYVQSYEKVRAAALIGLLCGIIATLAAAMLVSALELFDGRIRTEKDLARATRLPVLASLGDLNTMTEEQRQEWAFRTLALLKGRIGRGGSRAIVCGFISAAQGEGRSTWVDLLAKAARRRGNRVLVISPPDSANTAETPKFHDPSAVTAWNLPTDLAQRMALPDVPPILQMTLPASAWSLDWRRRWQDALQQWNRIENLVLLVDLPAASNPEAVLLSEEIPQLIWLCARDSTTTAETRIQMETLRYSKCQLIGSVFNRAVSPPWKRRLAHLVSLAWLGWSLSGLPTDAQQAGTVQVPPIANTNPPTAALSVSSPDRLADWQRRLTLGPGDVVNISIYDEPDSARNSLAIGPDGRLNYLEAQDIMAAGLTVDELRAHLEDILGKFHRSPRTVIIPSSYNSKKFFMLGSVARKGPVPLDHPMTLVEAVARAGGFVSKDGIILADFSRSFIIRKSVDGTFAPVKADFESLFLRGDLVENIQMSPEDYVFFLPTDLPEVYVLGDGMSTPGALPYGPNMSVLKAIASRGGFGDKAYRRRVLVVRGSLSHPETFIVNPADMLSAKTNDFKLEPRDIVYVSRRPWAKVEDLLEIAVSDFVRAVAITWTGANVGPFIKTPIF